MTREKLFAEAVSGGCTDDETHGTRQREREDYGKAGDIWDPTRLYVLVFEFEEHTR